MMQRGEVSIEEMMDFRDMKDTILKEYLDRYPGSIVLSLGMNIPGPRKNNDRILKGFTIGEKSITDLLEKNNYDIADTVTINSRAGNVGLYVVKNADARQLKKDTVEIEEGSSLGRFYDLDVYRTDGTQVSRNEIGMEGRKCLICGMDAKVCGRSRAHSLRALEKKIYDLLDTQ